MENSGGNTAQENRQIQEQIGLLSSAIKEQEKLSEELETRLQPALREGPPESEKADKPEDHLVPMADQIRRIRRRAVTSYTNMGHLLDRLEI